MPIADGAQMDPLETRLAAVDTLYAVTEQRRTLDDVLARSTSYAALSASDKRRMAFIVRTALRRLGQIDALIDACLHKPLSKRGSDVRTILRIGVTQLLFSATPEHAAVDTTVELCRSRNLNSYVKLVNAVMRRLQREGRRLVRHQDVARLNTPTWLWTSWCETFGELRTREIAGQHLRIPPIDVTPKSAPRIWAERLGGHVLLGGTVRLEPGTEITSQPGFEEGEWWVQDAAARLPALLFGDLNGRTVIDLCAAPGGKSLQLAASGGLLTAIDISETRLARVRENFRRTGLDANFIAADARRWRPAAAVDAVLLDAPCSATGTMRRHPDVASLKSPADVERLCAIQDALLDSAATMLRPGGTLVYATCSLQSEEGPERIAAFLSRHANFACLPIDAHEIDGMRDLITSRGELRTLPSHMSEAGGMDGFYAARLIRKDASRL